MATGRGTRITPARLPRRPDPDRCPGPAAALARGASGPERVRKERDGDGEAGSETATATRPRVAPHAHRMPPARLQKPSLSGRETGFG
ncbi:MAG: hypothetical protein AVDCRST_MAG19-963 [uncultured Thermomicrobiales bacterium]|uniref:Uncharacterized protein n=1 Tax=uncultured Thermomicrobiales bacterium TaxID=1645740 RepID=A0A6J4UJZ8_9BACT|nr:MAG: hypothetical protein AVDCRST_MAG19-963 [uncultured Thermomicrobiales bacterium]